MALVQNTLRQLLVRKNFDVRPPTHSGWWFYLLGVSNVGTGTPRRLLAARIFRGAKNWFGIYSDIHE